MVANVGAEIGLADVERLRPRETRSLEAWLLRKEGRVKWLNFTPEDNLLAQSLFEQALERDPQYVRALAHLSSTYRAVGNLVGPLARSWAGSADEAQRILVLAFALDPESSEAFNVLSNIRQAKKSVLRGRLLPQALLRTENSLPRFWKILSKSLISLVGARGLEPRTR